MWVWGIKTRLAEQAHLGPDGYLGSLETITIKKRKQRLMFSLILSIVAK